MKTDQGEIINDTRIDPKVIPFRCVVCKGFGTVNYGQQKCRACEGRGYLLVKQEEKYENY